MQFNQNRYNQFPLKPASNKKGLRIIHRVTPDHPVNSLYINPDPQSISPESFLSIVYVPGRLTLNSCLPDSPLFQL